MFRVRCKTCKHNFQVPDEKAGEPILCPYCSNKIIIRPGLPPKGDPQDVKPPTPARSAQPVPAPNETQTSTPPVANAPSAGEDEALILEETTSTASPPEPPAQPHRGKVVQAVVVDCRTCGLRMQISSQDIGKAIQCEKCRSVMKVELPTVEAAIAVAVEPTPTDLLTAPPLVAHAAPLDSVPTGSYARRRAAQAKSSLGEKMVVLLLILFVAGGLGWLGYYFMTHGQDPLNAKPVTESKQTKEKTLLQNRSAWVDAKKPNAWDRFAGAIWGNSPNSIPGIKPTDPPSKLFDSGELKWYRPTGAPGEIGGAKIHSICYAFLQLNGSLRLCEVRVQCQSTDDREKFQEWLTKQYGAGTTGQGVYATIEWHGKTSSDREIVIEIGGKVPTFDGTKIRAAVQGIR